MHPSKWGLRYSVLEAAVSIQQLLLQLLSVLPRRPLCQYGWGHGREL